MFSWKICTKEIVTYPVLHNIDTNILKPPSNVIFLKKSICSLQNNNKEKTTKSDIILRVAFNRRSFYISLSKNNFLFSFLLGLKNDSCKP